LIKLFDRFTHPPFPTLRQYPGSAFGNGRHIAPERIAYFSQIVQIGFSAFGQIPAAAAKECQALHFRLLIRAMIPRPQIILPVAPFAPETCPFADRLAEKAYRFDPFSVCQVPLGHDHLSLDPSDASPCSSRRATMSFSISAGLTVGA
jgi:hypothetical protein